MSSLRTITGFKERLAGGGARPNLFEVEIPSFPAPITNLWKAGAGQEIDTFKFLCKAAELWMNNISKLDNNSGATNPSSYMTDAYVHQLGRGYDKGRFSTTNNGGNDATLETNITPLRTYKFHSIFPTNVGPIDLSYDSSDTIEEYSVEFQVQYWTAGKGANKNDATNVLIS
jgi:hypothetical protein